MAKNRPVVPGRIQRLLEGEALEVADRTIRPRAEVLGWTGAGGDPLAGGAVGWLRVRPVEVQVQEVDGRRYSVAIMDPNRQLLRRLAVAGLAVGVIGQWFVSRSGLGLKAELGQHTKEF